MRDRGPDREARRERRKILNTVHKEKGQRTRWPLLCGFGEHCYPKTSSMALSESFGVLRHSFVFL